MKDFFKMFFASLLSMVVLGIVGFIIFILVIVSVANSFSSKDTKIVRGDVLVIDMDKKIHEQGQKNSFAAFSGSSAYEAGLYDMLRALEYAKTDNSIKGILLKLSPTPNGWATLQQLRLGLVDFKSSHKFIYAYGEDISQGTYFAASAADSVYLNPAGGIDLKGFSTELAYFKGALDKLDIVPEIYYAGKFKSATEPFRADKISEPNRIQIQAYQASLWDDFLTAVAQHTHTDKDSVNQWAQTGAIQFPNDALQHKMVDGLLYWDEVEHRIRQKTGQGDRESIRYVSMDDYALNARSGNVKDKHIAILFAEGDITDGESDEAYGIASKNMAATIRKIRNNDDIKAVVLRVNSPGGSALASEVILRELQLLKEKKPLIVSMGDYAASGGYYISSQADSIFALPTTITGSIGVFSMLFSIDHLMNNKLGVKFDGVKNAPYADVPTITRTMTAEEGQRLQRSVDTIYSLFKRHVAEGRRLDPADVDSIAQGRVWTGTDALKIKLIDGLGGLDRAIHSAASMAKLYNYKIVTYPEAGDKLDGLLKHIKMNTSASEALRTALKEELGSEFDIYKQISSLKKMNGKAMMTMPFVFSVN